MLTIEFVIITFWHYGDGYVFSTPHGGCEYPLVLLVLYAAIFFRGAGLLDRPHDRQGVLEIAPHFPDTMRHFVLRRARDTSLHAIAAFRLASTLSR
jgi:hypothetical protein